MFRAGRRGKLSQHTSHFGASICRIDFVQAEPDIGA
jgi:hypothetical protein